MKYTKHKFDTKYGEITIRDAMLDVNGTDLVDGIVINLNDYYAGELANVIVNEETTVEEVEKLYELVQ